jgi:hypothetical protein
MAAEEEEEHAVNFEVGSSVPRGATRRLQALAALLWAAASPLAGGGYGGGNNAVPAAGSRGPRANGREQRGSGPAAKRFGRDLITFVRGMGLGGPLCCCGVFVVARLGPR